jgi:hypothetical protein
MSKHKKRARGTDPRDTPIARSTATIRAGQESHRRIPAASYEGFLDWEVIVDDSISEPAAKQLQEAFDFIRNNAEYVDEMKQGADIAARGPLDKTITHFFRFGSSGPDRSYGVNVQVTFAEPTGEVHLAPEASVSVAINTAKKRLALLAPQIRLRRVVEELAAKNDPRVLVIPKPFGDN